MDAEYSYISPVDADLMEADNLCTLREWMMRYSIMRMASKLKGYFFLPSQTSTTAAETNYSAEDAVRAFNQISGGSGVFEFQSIVGKLPIDELQTLRKFLEEPYHAMLRSEMCPYRYPTWSPEVKAAGSDSFATKLAGQAIGAMLAKVVAGGAVFGALEAPTFLEPLEKAAGAMGLMSVIGGMVLQDKKPGLSRAMVKFGSVAVALAMILPMAGNLDNLIMSWIFGVLTAAIVAVTVTFA